MCTLLLADAAATQAADAQETADALIQSSAGLLAVLLTVLALIFWAQTRPVLGKIFKIIPALVFCYFVPTLLTSLGIIPAESPMYTWVKQFVLPASLVLLTLSLDVKGILGLGPKAVIMLLTGTAGIVLGGPLALYLWKGALPADAWREMAYLAGSWIGGGANALALHHNFMGSAAAPAPAPAPIIIIVDVAVANTWMGILLYWAARQERVDRWFGGDTSAIRALERKMHDYQARVARIASLTDWLIILALGFGVAWLSHLGGGWLAERQPAFLDEILKAFAWTVIMATTVGMVLSFTKARSLEGAGASRVGSVMIYLLVASIGAQADFSKLAEGGAYLGMGATWILFHICLLLIVGRLIRAPFFFIAVGSQANIGGAASAPVVAGAFNPVLAPVGVLLAIAGYVLGTYAGIACITICKLVVGAG